MGQGNRNILAFNCHRTNIKNGESRKPTRVGKKNNNEEIYD